MDDMTLFAIVVIARLLLPLLIIRFPLPGVIICLVLDAVDQTIFQKFTTLNLDGYQSYDKALDIYYLTMAYISTFRNWTNHFAFRISRFLYYYRMIGVTLYEFLHQGIILLIFPNTFEYFFIFYEIVKLSWNPDRLTRKRLIGVAAFIWIFIKLPQEYWIHIAHNDTTDMLKEYVFHVPLDATFSQILDANMWLIPFVIGVVVAIVFIYKFVMKRLPKPDWKMTFDSNKLLKDVEISLKKQVKVGGSLLDSTLTEKVVMIGLLGIIFAQILPGTNANSFDIAIGVAILVSANAVVSNWLASSGMSWNSMVKEFIVMGLVNYGLIVVYASILMESGGSINVGNTLFFALLMTLLVTLYDRYRVIYDARFVSN